jgi:hypothetical protein
MMLTVKTTKYKCYERITFIWTRTCVTESKSSPLALQKCLPLDYTKPVSQFPASTYICTTSSSYSGQAISVRYILIIFTPNPPKSTFPMRFPQAKKGRYMLHVLPNPFFFFKHKHTHTHTHILLYNEHTSRHVTLQMTAPQQLPSALILHTAQDCDHKDISSQQ